MSVNIGPGTGNSAGGTISVGQDDACAPDKVVDIKGGTSPGGTTSVTTPPACKSCFIYSNILWVDPSGNDSSAVTGDIFKPWKTIAGAQSSAVAGELIYVMPGTYSESNLGKDQIQYHLSGNTTVNGNFTDGGNDITFSIHGDGIVVHTGITLSLTGNSTVSVYDVDIKSTGDNAVVNQTDGLPNFVRSNIINTNTGSSAHGISTTVTSTTYDLRLENMSIVLSSASAEAISASNAFSVFCITDIGSTNSFNANVTNYHPGTFMYTEPLLAV